MENLSVTLVDLFHLIEVQSGASTTFIDILEFVHDLAALIVIMLLHVLGSSVSEVNGGEISHGSYFDDHTRFKIQL